MDLRHICHLVAETLKLAGGNLLGEDAGAVRAEVAALAEETGTVVLSVECREYALVIHERKHRPDRPEASPISEEATPAAGGPPLRGS
jgi:hypothetical protein